MSLRKRATIIVEMPKGILLVSHSRKSPPTFMLVGGGVRKNERSILCAIRELYEEKGLHTKKIEHLFDLDTQLHRHKVFLARTNGRLRMRNEIRYIAFWNNKTKGKLKTAWHVKAVIRKYLLSKHC